MRTLGAISIVVLCTWAAGQAPGPATAPATAPATQRSWGNSKAGLSVSVAPVGQWTVGAALKLDFALRNSGKAPATLPEKEAFYGYLLLAQGQTIHYTSKIFHARHLANWPERLAGGEELRFEPVDVGALEAFTREPGLLLSKGYPVRLVDGKPVPRPAVGTAAKVLQPGPVKVKYVAYLDRRDEGGMSLESKVSQVELRFGDFAGLSDAMRRRLLADLARRMTKDAWSAKTACADAVRIGRGTVSTLTAIATDPKAAFFARMWSATALSDIGGAEAARVVTACLDDANPGVRHVAAYHGLKLRDGAFDKALNRQALSGKDPMSTAWALLGYARFRGGAPPELLKAAVQSPQEPVRLAVARVFSRIRPVPAQLTVLRTLARDQGEHVRYLAAMSLGASKDDSRETIESLLACLAMPGDRPRYAASGALCKLTGMSWLYLTNVPKQRKDEVVRQWQQWWERSRDRYPPAGSGK